MFLDSTPSITLCPAEDNRNIRAEARAIEILAFDLKEGRESNAFLVVVIKMIKQQIMIEGCRHIKKEKNKKNFINLLLNFWRNMVNSN